MRLDKRRRVCLAASAATQIGWAAAASQVPALVGTAAWGEQGTLGPAAAATPPPALRPPRQRTSARQQAGAGGGRRARVRPGARARGGGGRAAGHHADGGAARAAGARPAPAAGVARPAQRARTCACAASWAPARGHGAAGCCACGAGGERHDGARRLYRAGCVRAVSPQVGRHALRSPRLQRPGQPGSACCGKGRVRV